MGSRPPRTSKLKDGRVIKGNFPERWTHGLLENTGYQRGNYNKIEYDGKVWCLEIEDNHNFLIERSGQLTFSGNSSEELGDVLYSPQNLDHPLRPMSPYGAAKVASRMLVRVYRESYKMYAVQGMLFNHESPGRRGNEFISRKITLGVARIYHALKSQQQFKPIEVGNVYAKRDWSDARDFVEGVWLMMNQEKPKEYVLASGQTHEVKEFIEKAFTTAGISGHWEYEKENEKFIINGFAHGGSEIMTFSPRILVAINPKFYRPAEVNLLMGDPKEAIEELGWKPKISFDQLVREMVKYDIENFDKEYK
jgi:GDPmannose 4,6-dehydratase